MSPVADFGEKLNFSSSQFTKLNSKGEKIHFRVLGKPTYEGKHFIPQGEGEKKEVIACPRINEGGECETCKLFFAAHRSAKKEGLDKDETRKLTDPYSPAAIFYYPVLNRGTGKFEIFQTTQGVRNNIESKIELGLKVFERDLIILRTEKPGSYYQLSVVDSADAKPFTKEEKEEVKKGKEADLSDYIDGQQEDTPEDIDVDL